LSGRKEGLMPDNKRLEELQTILAEILENLKPLTQEERKRIIMTVVEFYELNKE